MQLPAWLQLTEHSTAKSSGTRFHLDLCAMQVATQDYSHKILVSPLENGEDTSQDPFKAISAHLGLASSSLKLERQYAAPAVHVYSATSTTTLSPSDLCAAIKTAAGSPHSASLSYLVCCSEP